MSVLKKQLMATSLLIWLGVVCFLMILGESLNLGLFFVLWLIGILAIFIVFDLSYAACPSYITNMKYVVSLGILVFGIYVLTKIMGIISA